MLNFSEIKIYTWQFKVCFKIFYRLLNARNFEVQFTQHRAQDPKESFNSGA